MIRATGIVPLSLLFFSCSTVPPETTEGKAVTVILTDVPANCKELKTVQWEGDRRHTLVDAKVALREEVARLGGNYLRMESLALIQASYPLAVGTAYNCPK